LRARRSRADSEATAASSADPNGVLPSSDQVNGRISRYTARPARDSETCRMRRRFAEPVHRNRPGVRLRSTSSLMTESSLGARWISSIVIGSAPMRRASGSRTAVSMAVKSSREVYVRDDPIPGD
jgi:hypothetical protein